MRKKFIHGGRILAAGALFICLMRLSAPAALAMRPGEAAFTVKQTFANTGAFTPPGETFSYKLTPKAALNPMPAGSGPEGCAFAVTGTSDMQISIAFTQAGRYAYELRHVTAPQPGYRYDQEIYTLEVFVGSDLAVTAVAHKSDGSKAPDIRYAHAYSANPLPSDPGAMADPPVVKTVSGSPSRSGVFTFRLTAGDPSNPMPQGSANGVKTLRITGAGRGEFGTWSYQREGTYFYTVSEVNTGESGYTYDSAVYTITDSVRDADGRLQVTRVVTNGTNKQVASLSFINTYTQGGRPAAPEGKPGQPGQPGQPGKPGPNTGDETRVALDIALFIAGGMAALGSICYLLVCKRREEKA